MGEAKRKDTSIRAIVDAIDELIKLRLEGVPNTESIELTKREICDGMRLHSGAKGIYVEGQHR